MSGRLGVYWVVLPWLLAGVAEAAPCLETATLLDSARLARDSQDSLYRMLRTHDERRERLIDAYVAADQIPRAHGGLATGSRLRALAGGRACEGGVSLGGLTRAELDGIADVMLPESELEIVALVQWQSIEATAPDSRVALGLDRLLVGGRVTWRDWVSVSGAYVGADRPRGGQAGDAAVRLGDDHVALGVTVPRYGIGGDLLVDTEGRVSRARVLSTALPLPLLDGVAYLSTGWRRPSDEFFVRAEAVKVGGVFVAGIDVVPIAPELRTAWVGLAHDWRHAFESTVGHVYLGLDGRLSTFGSAAVRAVNGGERAMGAAASLGAGYGGAGVQIGFVTGVGYNTPDNLEALPTLADQVEFEAMVMFRLGL